MAQRVNIGVIGAGFVGRVHMSKFRTLEGVTLAGVADTNRDQAEAAARAWGVEAVFESVDSLLSTDMIQAVVVAVPNRFHADLAVKAVDAGKHVLLEKPMAMNAEEARKIVDARKRSGKTLMIGHQMRWQWLSLNLKEQVENGDLGRIYAAKTQMMRKKGVPGWGSWFTRKADSGGGALIDIGVHMLDLSLWLMGNPKPVSVFGKTYAEFGPLKRGLGSWGTPEWDGRCDVEDLATAIITMEDGSTLGLDVSWAVHTDSDNKHAIHLMGTEGGASLYGSHLKYVGQKFGSSFDVEVTPPETADDQRILLSQHFIDCILEEKQPVSDGMSGLVNNMILDAIYESSETGHLVELDWSGID